MPDFEREFTPLRYQRTSFRELLKRIDRLNKSSKPTFGGFRLFSGLADEPNIVFGIL
jgi:hypothetical protein